ncbi:hypothetical protein NX801_06320 [Streptomyces sp. LP05-1]|uniref:Integral membrane protein n=1 Tax=Streptomyces pyxinae TaxID=2970734 RepID=A0ABT2CCY3_9ACTN|nr:hypothetical protein [Streptomyces sp. LP05-1]MCS0635276.1 hypothetical protein [Streptomyces sp. LP05-1]
MATHAPSAGRHRRALRPAPRTRPGGRNAVVLSLALAVFYGFYAQFIDRSGDGPVTGGQVVLGVASAVVFGALALTLVGVRHRLPRELRAAAYGALTGVALGWLYSLTRASVLSAVVLSVIVTLATTVAVFYVIYTHEA